MHTQFTTDLARQIVSDRLREADTARLARKARRSRRREAGTGTTERVVSRDSRRPFVFTSDIIGAR